jgi:hypothetical protein
MGTPRRPGDDLGTSGRFDRCQDGGWAEGLLPVWLCNVGWLFERCGIGRESWIWLDCWLAALD